MRNLRAFAFGILLCFTGQSPALAESSKTILDFSAAWEDQDGKSQALSNFKGVPVLLTMAYTHCSNACPLTVERLRKIYSALNDKGKQVQVLVVSLDPERDNPAALKQFMAERHIDLPRWHLLQGKPADTRAFAVLIGYSFRKEFNSDEIIHSNKILLLDKTGETAFSLEGLNSDYAPLIEKVD